MAKKKSPKKIPHDEVIHFRPGKFLGGLIASVGDEWQLSRGEAAKRLVTLAIRGLPIDAYDRLNELAGYTTCDFGQACELAYAEIRIAIQERTDSAEANLAADGRIAVVERLVQRFRQVHSTPEDEEELPRERISQLHE